MFGVRLTPVPGTALVVLGAVSLLPGLWLLALDTPHVSLVAGVGGLMAGAVLRRRTYFWFTFPDEGEDEDGDERAMVCVPGRRGTLVQCVMTGPGERFAVEGGRLVHVAADGTRPRVLVRRWMARPRDWRILERILAASEELPDGDGTASA